MDTKIKILSALVLPLILLSGFQCSNNSKLIESIPETTFIDDCPDVLPDFGEMVTVGDPADAFLIQLPNSWDIRQNFGDSLYGVFASNSLSIPKPPEESLSLSVTGYNTKKELDQYVHDELIGLIKEENIQVLERGTSMFSGNKNPWVLFEIEPGIFNMVYYIKDHQNSNIYLIQSVSYDTVNYKYKMCNLKHLVKSFELVK